MKFWLTKKEERLYARALYYQGKSEELILKFTESLRNRFPNSEVISDFEAFDLWTLNPSDSTGDSSAVNCFWNEVREELLK